MERSKRTTTSFNIYKYPIVDNIFPDGVFRIILASYYDAYQCIWVPIKRDLDEIHEFMEELRQISWSTKSKLVDKFFRVPTNTGGIPVKIYDSVYGRVNISKMDLGELLEEIYPDVLEALLNPLRLFIQIFSKGDVNLLRSVLRHIGEDKAIWKMTDLENLTIESQGIWKYKYNIGDTNYLRIPEEDSVDNLPLVIGLSSKEGAIVTKGFDKGLSEIREKLKIFLGSNNKKDKIISEGKKSNVLSDILSCVIQGVKRIWEK